MPQSIDPELNDKYEKLKKLMIAAGFPIKIISGVRSTEEQQKLYNQGRGSKGNIVTEDDGIINQSKHQLGKALDIGFDGLKQNYDLLGQKAKELGLEWGGDWTSLVDKPHIQLPSNNIKSDIKPNFNWFLPNLSENPIPNESKTETTTMPINNSNQIKSGDDVTHLMSLKSGDDVTHLMNPIDGQNESFLSNIWNKVTKPTVDIRGNNPQLKTATDEFAKAHPWIGGPLNFATDTLSGLSSLLNLATTGAFTGEGIAAKAGLPAIAKGLNLAGRGLSAPVVGEGIKHISEGHPISGGLETIGGLVGMGHSIKPEINPRISESNINPNINPDAINPTGMTAEQQAALSPIQPEPSITPRFNPKGVTGMAGNKPRYRINTDGTYTNLDTGEINDIATKLKSIPDESRKIVTNTPEKSITTELINLPRALQASMDLSAPLRQGLPLITRKEWWTSWKPMVQSLGSETAYKSVMDSITEHPNFDFGQQIGLKLTDLNHLSSREEAIMNTWAEKVPGVRASNRAYTAYLNKLRSDTFNSLIDDADRTGLAPKTDMVLSKQIADFVNNATGRGDLGALEKNAQLLNNTFFSPRLIASRVQMMNPSNYVMTNPFVRKQYLKGLLSVTGAWLTVGTLGKMAGADVSLDTNNADFGKVKIGNTRLDPAAGFQQYLVAASRLMSGKRTSSTTGETTDLGSGYGKPTRLNVAEDFASNKLNPLWKFAYDLLDATPYKPFNSKERIAQLFIPMIMQDIYDIMKDDPKLLPMVSLGATGMGLQTYGEQ